MLHIRTDGNGTIGTGHVMRCLEIARAYKETIGPVQFIVADEESKNFIEKQGNACYKLDSVWNDLDSEIAKIPQCVRECQVTHLLIDSYFVTENYVEEWKKAGVKVAYLDDLCCKSYSFDAVFNGALWAKEEMYRSLYAGRDTKFYLGCDYLPLRQEFSKVPKKQVLSQAQNVLVLSGGTDTFHFVREFVKNLPHDMEMKCQYFLVCGIYNNDYEEILSLCAGRENIHVLRDVKNLHEYMVMADVAVSAGGMTLYELCACGTPAITYLIADNQQGNVDGFLAEEIFESIGDIRNKTDFKLLFSKLSALMDDYEMRKRKAQKIQTLVDGKGAYRIAEKLGNM